MQKPDFHITATKDYSWWQLNGNYLLSTDHPCNMQTAGPQKTADSSRRTSAYHKLLFSLDSHGSGVFSLWSLFHWQFYVFFSSKGWSSLAESMETSFHGFSHYTLLSSSTSMNIFLHSFIPKMLNQGARGSQGCHELLWRVPQGGRREVMWKEIIR